MNALAMRRAWNYVQDEQELIQAAVYVVQLQVLHVKPEVNVYNTEYYN